MTASEEWEEMHLTFNGWVLGSLNYDSTGFIEVELPADRVLSMRKKACSGKTGEVSSVSCSAEIFFCDHNKDLVINLLLKHGKPFFSV